MPLRRRTRTHQRQLDTAATAAHRGFLSRTFDRRNVPTVSRLIKPDGTITGDSLALMHARTFTRDLPADWFEIAPWASGPRTGAWHARLQFVRIWLLAYERATSVARRQELTRAIWRTLLFPPPPPYRYEAFMMKSGRIGYRQFLETPQKPTRGRPILKTQHRVRAVLDAHNVEHELGTDLLDYLQLLPRAARVPGTGRGHKKNKKKPTH